MTHRQTSPPPNTHTQSGGLTIDEVVEASIVDGDQVGAQSLTGCSRLVPCLVLRVEPQTRRLVLIQLETPGTCVMYWNTHTHRHTHTHTHTDTHTQTHNTHTNTSTHTTQIHTRTSKRKKPTKTNHIHTIAYTHINVHTHTNTHTHTQTHSARAFNLLWREREY